MTTGAKAVLVILSLVVGFLLAAVATFLTYGNSLAIGVALLTPVVAALAYASRT